MTDIFSFTPYTWQHTVWQSLTDRFQRKQLAHALVLNGPDGIGKYRLAQALAAYALCAQPTHIACGQCRSCQLLMAGTHPDLVFLQPEVNAKTGKVSQVIKIDQVRDVVDFGAKSAQLGRYRVVIIEPAHVLNVQAANALLKTLEEPGLQTLFLLVSSQFLSLPATIRSRCQRVDLAIPAQQDALAWLLPQVNNQAQAELLLALAHGAPLATLELLNAEWFTQRPAILRDLSGLAQSKFTALSVASRWQSLKSESLVMALLSLCEDIIALALGANAVKNTDLRKEMSQLAGVLSPADVLQFYQKLGDKKRLSFGNIQDKVIVDMIFTEWSQLAVVR